MREKDSKISQEYMDFRQCAKYLGKSESAIRKWVEAKKIPFAKTPSGSIIFKKSRIDEWYFENEVIPKKNKIKSK